MKLATLALTALFVLMPFQAQAAKGDVQTIYDIQRQIQILQAKLDRLILNQTKYMPKPKASVPVTASASVETEKVSPAVERLDRAWAIREAELNAKYKIPGKWKLVDDKAMKEFKKYEEKRASLLLGQ